MKKTSRYKFYIVAFGILSGLLAHSQNKFAYKAVIDSIKETKFYKINLSPAIVAKCKPGFEDIRILDEDGKQVSYILKNDLPVFQTENFIEFPIVKTIKEKDKQTHVTIQSSINKSIDNLLLFVKNTEAHRTFNISGSVDSTHWFVIKENIYLDNSFKAEDETIIQSISFPPSNYSYFQLTILGEDVLSFNIIKAGIFKEDLMYGGYIPLPTPAIFQKDSSNKTSYIRIRFGDQYLVNKITFYVDGAKYFKRKFSLFKQDGKDDFLLEGYVSSETTNEFIINGRSGQFLLAINNEDNVPLKVNAVGALQLNTYLLTYLEAGKRYFLNFGDSATLAPKYDLEFFSDSANKNPSEISVNSFEKNKILSAANTPSSKNNKLLLWIIIGIVLVVLCFFTIKMMDEVRKKSEKDLHNNKQ
ncbi:MAG TPA: hypothetical protein VGP55_02600 [Chitinophagaceae bacterium]|nr:hypothetical protein [Chitinophagaceae bacterium]